MLESCMNRGSVFHKVRRNAIGKSPSQDIYGSIMWSGLKTMKKLETQNRCVRWTSATTLWSWQTEYALGRFVDCYAIQADTHPLAWALSWQGVGNRNGRLRNLYTCVMDIALDIHPRPSRQRSCHGELQCFYQGLYHRELWMIEWRRVWQWMTAMARFCNSDRTTSRLDCWQNQMVKVRTRMHRWCNSNVEMQTSTI